MRRCAIRLRRWLTASKRRWLPVHAVAYALCAVAVASLIAGWLILGVATAVAGAILFWFGGLWVLPWGADAYQVRVGRALRDEHAALKVTSGQAQARDVALAERAARLRPPGALKPTHAQILALLQDANQPPADDVAERTTRSMERSQALRRLELELHASTFHPNERQYANAIADVLRAHRDVSSRLVDQVEHEIDELIVRLSRAKPPAPWADSHAELLAAFRAYGSAVRSYYEAAAGDEPDLALAASRTEERCRQRVGDATDRLQREIEADWSGGDPS